MDTRFLESFIAVADEGSIASAARTLNLTPAAVSQRIKALEDEIGSALLARTGRTVSPTEAGRAILERARTLTREVRDLQAMASADRPAGELRVGANSTGVSGLLPGVLAALNAAHPEMRVLLSRGHSSGLYPRVMEGELDVSTIVEASFPLPKSCGWREVRSEPLVLLTPEGMDVSDPDGLLSAQPFIRYNQGRWGRSHALNYLRDRGIRPETRFELDALDAIAIMVDRGLGVSLIPDYAPPWPEGLNIRKTPIEDDAYSRRLGLVWLRASPKERLIRAFVEAFAGG